jgi:hypothetical protein
MLDSDQGVEFTQIDKLGLGVGFGLGVPLFIFIVLAIIFGRKASAERAKNAARLEAPSSPAYE